MENIHKHKARLIKIHLNFKKNPNRVHSEKWLNEIKEEVNNIIRDCEKSNLALGLFNRIVVKEDLQECHSVYKTILNIVAWQRELRESGRTETNCSDEMSEGSTSAENSDEPVIAARGEADEIVIAAQRPTTMASFNDIEGAVDKFDGRSIDVKGWIASFENVARACECSELQKFLFCKRLLTGAAKLAVEGEADTNTFAKIKTCLEENFAVTVSISEVHRQLNAARKDRLEDSFEFALRMKRTAALAKVDDTSLIDYIIRGLGGQRVEKIGLYEAKTFAELRDKLKTYEKVKSSAEYVKPIAKTSPRPASSSSTNSSDVHSSEPRIKQEKATLKCYNCNENGHLRRNCTKPSKCFKCQKEGHFANNCPEAVGQERA